MTERKGIIKHPVQLEKGDYILVIPNSYERLILTFTRAHGHFGDGVLVYTEELPWPLHMKEDEELEVYQQ